MSATTGGVGLVVGLVVGTIHLFIEGSISWDRLVDLLIGRWLNYLPVSSVFIEEARIKLLAYSKELFGR